MGDVLIQYRDEPVRVDRVAPPRSPRPAPSRSGHCVSLGWFLFLPAGPGAYLGRHMGRRRGCPAPAFPPRDAAFPGCYRILINLSVRKFRRRCGKSYISRPWLNDSRITIGIFFLFLISISTCAIIRLQTPTICHKVLCRWWLALSVVPGYAVAMRSAPSVRYE